MLATRKDTIPTGFLVDNKLAPIAKYGALGRRLPRAPDHVAAELGSLVVVGLGHGHNNAVA
jgi:hypothetical protein